MNNTNSAVFFMLRLMTCGIWLSAGLHKIFNSGFHITGIEMHGMAFAATAIFAVVVLVEIGGSILMLLNKYVWAVSLAWMVFLVPASILYHTGWMGEFSSGNFVGTPPSFFPFFDMVTFFKNVSIFGGLMALILMDQTRPQWLSYLLEKQSTATPVATN